MRYVAIRGMKPEHIPTDCEYCFGENADCYYCNLARNHWGLDCTSKVGKPDWCPLIIVDGEEVQDG